MYGAFYYYTHIAATVYASNMAAVTMADRMTSASPHVHCEIIRRRDDDACVECVPSHHQRKTTNHFGHRSPPWQVQSLLPFILFCIIIYNSNIIFITIYA